MTEKSGMLQSMLSQRVGHNLATEQQIKDSSQFFGLSYQLMVFPITEIKTTEDMS